ncbi:MAG: type II secretion system F family protein [Bradyrhizobium sp.]|nr:type II secretion system F family protein [Pseudomonadota bacterium]MDE2471420.1 type II secretion system F family protein [Bradyrhizobium sp.]
MPTFRYEAYRSDGAFAEGMIEAVSLDAANDLLWSRGLSPYQMRASEEAETKWWNRDIRLGDGTRRADLLTFTRQFSMLNGADIPLDSALRILNAQASSHRLRSLVEQLLSDVLAGAALSDAMQKQPKLFPPDYIAVIRAGEMGGRLGAVLIEVAELLERRAEIRQRVQSALIYPSILVVLSIGTLGILLGGLIPSFAPVFVQSGKPLPASLQVMLMIRDHWIEIGTGVALGTTLLLGTAATANRKPGTRLQLDHLKLRLPLLGSFLLRQETARFTRTLASMLKAGVPLTHAAKTSCSVLGNRYITDSLERTIEAVHQGSALNTALHAEAVLPAIALQMIAVGEEAGKLDHMLTHVASMLEKEIQNNIDRFMSALTPALTVGIALLVGTMIMPVMSAVLSINDLAAR